MSKLLEAKNVDNKGIILIKIIMGIDDDGYVRAKRLFQFLGIEESKYSKWCKKYIENNVLASRNNEFISLDLNDGSPSSGQTEYKLTIKLARLICSRTNTERSERAENYLSIIEEKLSRRRLGYYRNGKEKIVF